MALNTADQNSSTDSSLQTMASPPPLSLQEPDTSAPFPNFDFAYEEPLYTEINIPLPRLPSPSRTSLQRTTPQSNSPVQPTLSSSSSSRPTTGAKTQTSSHNRSRAKSLSSFPLFRSRSSSTSTQTSASTCATEPWPRVRPAHVKNREVAAAMDLRHQSKRGRSSTIDALAVVPAVLVLSAELFTPGTGESEEKGRDGKGSSEGRRKDSGVGRWVDAVR
ncbi:hypothetical protein FB567DRAFT_176104 [Paraphoma chrysanthemicola]|uniref:Uncharacterized protein n=1 Tax=Paraphoma chrysanthemicola TaxID=798071 RepID=A0A8K0W3L0_9PLEO|nr:hypothetical protein FB567DRAFT_176104 [Paraphoma chrysanthemicola]